MLCGERYWLDSPAINNVIYLGWDMRYFGTHSHSSLLRCLLRSRPWTLTPGFPTLHHAAQQRAKLYEHGIAPNSVATTTSPKKFYLFL